MTINSTNNSTKKSPSHFSKQSMVSHYLHISGTQLIDGQGKNIKLSGATMYPATFTGKGWASPDFPSYIDTILTMAIQAHLNVIRATDILQYGDWQNTTLWTNLDYLINNASEKHIWIIIDLSAFRNSLDAQGQFAYDPSKWQDFITFITHRYKNAKNVAYYEISGEPQDPKRDAGHEPTAEQLLAFYRTISEMIYDKDSNHIIGTGSFAHLNEQKNIHCTDMKKYCIPWQQIYALPHIDLPGTHIYSDGDFRIAVPLVQQWTVMHNKPFSIDEFGFKQGMGDSARAAAYANIYKTIRAYGNNVNTIFWNLGPQLAPTSYEVSPQTPQTWQVVKNANDLLK